MTDEQAAEALELDEDKYALMDISVRLELASYRWYHSPDSLREFMNLPDKVEIPADLTNKDDISDWLSEEFGFCLDGFKLSSDEQKNVKEETFKKGRGR